jgi:hypothetical protein
MMLSRKRLNTGLAILATGSIGILAGLGIGQATSDAGAYTDPYLPLMKSMDRNLKAINSKLGANYVTNSVLAELDDIEHNTAETCQAAKGTYYTC